MHSFNAKILWYDDTISYNIIWRVSWIWLGIMMIVACSQWLSHVILTMPSRDSWGCRTNTTDPTMELFGAVYSGLPNSEQPQENMAIGEQTGHFFGSFFFRHSRPCGRFIHFFLAVQEALHFGKRWAAHGQFACYNIVTTMSLGKQTHDTEPTCNTLYIMKHGAWEGTIRDGVDLSTFHAQPYMTALVLSFSLEKIWRKSNHVQSIGIQIGDCVPVLKRENLSSSISRSK